jgi:predicted dehydrogenase
MSGKIIRVAVLGQGRSGYDIHVSWLRKAVGQYKVVAVADLMPERHEAVKELGAKGLGDYRELLGRRELGVDLVVNALPSHLHRVATIAALEAGYHVLSEKPFALSVADFDAMVAAAKKAGRHLLAFQNSRFRPAFQKIQQLLAEGWLGKLVHARISFSSFARRWDWQTYQRYGGGNINNTGPHPLDQAVVLFGERMPRVFGRLACNNPFGDADDFASVSLYGDADAPLVEAVVSSCMTYPQGEVYNLSCTCGGLSGDFRTLRWRYFDPAKAPAHGPAAGWSDRRQFCSEQLPWVEESWTDVPADRSLDEIQRLSQGLYNDIYGVLVEGRVPVVRLEEVRRQIAVLEECHKQNPLPRRFG